MLNILFSFLSAFIAMAIKVSFLMKKIDLLLKSLLIRMPGFA